MTVHADSPSLGLIPDGSNLMNQQRAVELLDLAEAYRAATKDHASWLERLDAVAVDLEESWRYFLQVGDIERALRILQASGYWQHHGKGAMVSAWLRETLARADEVEPAIRAQAWIDLGDIALGHGHAAASGLPYETALDLYRQAGDDVGICSALCKVGFLHWLADAPEEAAALGHEALEHANRADDEEARCSALRILGLAASSAGRYEEAVTILTEVADREHRRDNRGELAGILTELGGLALEQQDFDRGETWLKDALALRLQLRDPDAALVYDFLGRLEERRGDLMSARAHHQASREISEESGDVDGAVRSYSTLGDLALRMGDRG